MTQNYLDKPLCPKPFMEMYITVNGDVYPCCSSLHSLGNIENENIEDIWNKGFEEYRKLLSNGKMPGACRNYCLILALGLELSGHGDQ